MERTRERVRSRIARESQRLIAKKEAISARTAARVAGLEKRITEIRGEIGKLHHLRGERYSRINARLDELHGLPTVFSCIPKHRRPISVRIDMEELIRLVVFPELPGFGFLVIDEARERSRGGSHWLRLSCGVKALDERQPFVFSSFDTRFLTSKATFLVRVGAVARGYSVHTLFMEYAYYWNENYSASGIAAAEARNCYRDLRCQYAHAEIETAFGYVSLHNVYGPLIRGCP